MPTYEKIGNMFVRRVDSPSDTEQWAYQSERVDTAEDVGEGKPEYKIQVVLPELYPNGGQYPVLYLPPVNTDDMAGIALAEQLDLHNKHQAILVSNTVKSVPWYGTKADGSRRYDTHVLSNIFRFIDQKYSTFRGRENRLICGYSKSGWGALSLLLRSPDNIGYVAAWDSPWNYTFKNRAIAEAFGTERKFLKYDPLTILTDNIESVNDRPRIWLGCGLHFEADHSSMSNALVNARVSHLTRFIPTQKHEWDAEWMMQAVDALFAMRAGDV